MILDTESMFDTNNMLTWLMKGSWTNLHGEIRPERVLKDVEVARDYLHARHIAPDVLGLFNTGWCDGFWLLDELRSRKIPPSDIFYTGLLKGDEEGKVWCPFDRRIVWPITTIDGHVAAFCGRTLNSNEKKRKYLNSPDSLVYRKREIPFGLMQALPGVIRTGRMIYVEGQLDVMAMHTMGIRETVAICGSSPSMTHVMYAQFLAATVYVMFDGDRAGRVAAMEMGQLCATVGVPVKYVTLAAGTDPCDMLQHDDREERINALLDAATEEFHGANEEEEAEGVHSRPDEGDDTPPPVAQGNGVTQESLIPL